MPLTSPKHPETVIIPQHHPTLLNNLQLTPQGRSLRGMEFTYSVKQSRV